MLVERVVSWWTQTVVDDIRRQMRGLNKMMHCHVGPGRTSETGLAVGSVTKDFNNNNNNNNNNKLIIKAATH